MMAAWISILHDDAFSFLFGSYEGTPPFSFSTLNDSGLLIITCDQEFAEIVEHPDFLASVTSFGRCESQVS
jgi:hypothetical protein